MLEPLLGWYLRNRDSIMEIDKKQKFTSGPKHNRVLQHEIDPNKLGRAIRADDYVKADWKGAYSELRNMGHTLNSIQKELGGYVIRNNIYSDYNMPYNVFEKFRDMAERNGIGVPFSIIEKERISCDAGREYDKSDPKLAEMLGIIHGDGNISVNGTRVTLNSIKEVVYAEYVSELMKKTIHSYPIIDPSNQGNWLNVIINSRFLVRDLLELDMEMGDKTINQAEVPQFVQSDLELSKSFVKGLFDSDGCIYFNRHKTTSRISVMLSFSNRNKHLPKFFSEICNSRGMKAGFSGPGKRGEYTSYIYRRDSVIKFVDTMGSEKITAFIQRWGLTRAQIEKSFPLTLIMISTEKRNKKWARPDLNR